MPSRPARHRARAARSAARRLPPGQGRPAGQAAGVPGASTRGIRKLLLKLSHLTDRLLCRLWAGARLPQDWALVAVGGYGRAQLFPHSDVDVLVLLPDGDPPAAAAIEAFIGSCWDAGLEIGSSVRSVAECLSESAADVTVQTRCWKRACCAAARHCSTNFAGATTRRWTRAPFWWPRRWRCASATPSTRTRPTRWSPTARNRPAACATCSSSSGRQTPRGWAAAGASWRPTAWPRPSSCGRSSATRRCCS